MKSPHDIIIRPVLTEKSYDHFADKLSLIHISEPTRPY